MLGSVPCSSNLKLCQPLCVRIPKGPTDSKRLGTPPLWHHILASSHIYPSSTSKNACHSNSQPGKEAGLAVPFEDFQGGPPSHIFREPIPSRISAFLSSITSVFSGFSFSLLSLFCLNYLTSEFKLLELCTFRNRFTYIYIIYIPCFSPSKDPIMGTICFLSNCQVL